MKRRHSVLLVSLLGCGSVVSQEASPEFHVDAGGTSPIEPSPPLPALDAGRDAPIIKDAPADVLPDTPTACPPANVPSLQTVHLVVTNASGADRYLVTAGDLCDAFSVSFSHQAPLPLSLGFQCICECPPPGSARPGGLRRLGPGESYTLAWDARSLTTCTRTYDCSTNGWPGMGSVSEFLGASAPVGPGSYSATIGALTSLPQGCSSGDGTAFSCPIGYGGYPGPGPLPGPIATACPADVSATGGFVLPATGDVDVAITITQ
jgi:hypothetical protein